MAIEVVQSSTFTTTERTNLSASGSGQIVSPYDRTVERPYVAREIETLPDGSRVERSRSVLYERRNEPKPYVSSEKTYDAAGNLIGEKTYGEFLVGGKKDIRLTDSKTYEPTTGTLASGEAYEYSKSRVTRTVTTPEGTIEYSQSKQPVGTTPYAPPVQEINVAQLPENAIVGRGPQPGRNVIDVERSNDPVSRQIRQNVQTRIVQGESRSQAFSSEISLVNAQVAARQQTLSARESRQAFKEQIDQLTSEGFNMSLAGGLVGKGGVGPAPNITLLSGEQAFIPPPTTTTNGTRLDIGSRSSKSLGSTAMEFGGVLFRSVVPKKAQAPILFGIETVKQAGIFVKEEVGRVARGTLKEGLLGISAIRQIPRIATGTFRLAQVAVSPTFQTTSRALSTPRVNLTSIDSRGVPTSLQVRGNPFLDEDIQASLLVQGSAFIAPLRVGRILLGLGGAAITGAQAVVVSKTPTPKEIAKLGIFAIAPLVEGLRAGRALTTVIGRRFIPVSQLTEAAVLRGQRFPMTSSVAESIAKFEAERLPTGELPVSTATGDIRPFLKRLSSDVAPPEITGRPGAVVTASLKRLEDQGLYITPSTRTSTYFLRLSEYSPGFSILPRIGPRPGIIRTRISGVERIPLPLLRQERLTASQPFIEKSVGRPVAFIPKRTEVAFNPSIQDIGPSRELQAVISPGQILTLQDRPIARTVGGSIRETIIRFTGRNPAFTIFAGEPVPIFDYTLLKTVSTRRVVTRQILPRGVASSSSGSFARRIKPPLPLALISRSSSSVSRPRPIDLPSYMIPQDIRTSPIYRLSSSKATSSSSGVIPSGGSSGLVVSGGSSGILSLGGSSGIVPFEGSSTVPPYQPPYTPPAYTPPYVPPYTPPIGRPPYRPPPTIKPPVSPPGKPPFKLKFDFETRRKKSVMKKTGRELKRQPSLVGLSEAPTNLKKLPKFEKAAFLTGLEVRELLSLRK